VSHTARGVLDRREGEWAVVHLQGGPLELPRWMVPAAARDGDALAFSAREVKGAVRLEVRVERGGEDDPRARAARLQDRLRARQG
jgi:hypothetical protein